jgi:hypothetical protein
VKDIRLLKNKTGNLKKIGLGSHYLDDNNVVVF